MSTAKDGNLIWAVTSEMRSVSRKKSIFFKNSAAVGTAVVLMLFALSTAACGLLGGKQPPKSEILRLANALIASLDDFREKIESDTDFRQVEELARRDEQGKSTGPINASHVFSTELMRLMKQESPVDRIQKKLRSSETTYEGQAKEIKDALDVLEKEYKGSSQEALAQIKALKEFSGACNGFSQYALNPDRAKTLLEYVKVYRIHRSNVAKTYKVFVEGLKGWNVKEKGQLKTNWDAELEIAEKTLAQYEEKGMLG